MSCRKEQGFSLLELIMVLVVLTILAGILVALFYDSSDDAKLAVTKNIAHALTLGSQNNYVTSRTNKTKAVTVSNCQHVPLTLSQTNALPSGYTIDSLAIVVGNTVTCTLRYPGGAPTATFTAIGVTT